MSSSGSGGQTGGTPRIAGTGSGKTALTIGAGRGAARAVAMSLRLSIIFNFKASSILKSFKCVSSLGSFTSCISLAKKRLDFLTAFGLLFLCWVANGVPSRLLNVYLNFSYSMSLFPTRRSGLSLAEHSLFNTQSVNN
jgi:hypothetical protein